jgi:hypothetical protein
MNTTSEKSTLPKPKAGFPLASLALLVTVLACLLASADVDRWHKQYAWFAENGYWKLVAVFGAAGVFGGIVGLIYMFGSSAGWRTRKIAPFTGVLAGGTGLLILLAPGAMWRTILSVSILLTAVVLLRLDAD